MKILIACEYSGTVRDAFIARGHDAISCDLLNTEREGPHYTGDVMDIIHDDWDLIIAHPPCTYISNMSNCRIKEVGRMEKREEGFSFFMNFTKLKCAKVAIENPRGLPERRFQKPTQIIQPYQFGHPYSKATCLWLKGLPNLIPTKIVECIRKWDGKRYRTWVDTFGSPNAYKRSVTFPGIAQAMAEQWG